METGLIRLVLTKPFCKRAIIVKKLEELEVAVLYRTLPRVYLSYGLRKAEDLKIQGFKYLWLPEEDATLRPWSIRTIEEITLTPLRSGWRLLS